MTSQPLAPIIVENQVINWKVVSGIAVGVHKYTKTHISGGENPSSKVEIIIECVIRQDNGEEIPVKLSTWEEKSKAVRGKEGFDEIRIREEQRISIIRAYTEDRTGKWLIYINHDDKKWYWLNSYEKYWLWELPDIPQIGKFLDDIGIFEGSLSKKFLWKMEWFFSSSLNSLVFLSLVMTGCILAMLSVILDVFRVINHSNSFWFLLFGVISIAIGSRYILLFKTWKEQINPSRQIVKLQIAEMARSLLSIALIE